MLSSAWVINSCRSALARGPPSARLLPWPLSGPLCMLAKVFLPRETLGRDDSATAPRHHIARRL